MSQNKTKGYALIGTPPKPPKLSDRTHKESIIGVAPTVAELEQKYITKTAGFTSLRIMPATILSTFEEYIPLVQPKIPSI